MSCGHCELRIDCWGLFCLLCERAFKHSWKCELCIHVRFGTLEDNQYRSFQAVKRKKTGKGLQICLQCLTLSCSLHAISHDASHFLSLQVDSLTINCSHCQQNFSYHMLSPSARPLGSQNIISICNMLQNINLLRQFQDKAHKSCSLCKKQVYCTYRCFECRSLEVCGDCVEKLSHRHSRACFSEEKYPSWILPTLSQADNTTQALVNIFHIYESRPAIGIIKDDRDIHWYRFGEFFERIQHVGSALSHLVPSSLPIEGQYILIATSICYKSFVLDYMCFLFGLIPIRVHYNISMENAQHILNQLPISILSVENENSSLFNAKFISQNNIQMVISVSELSEFTSLGCMVISINELEDKGRQMKQKSPVVHREPEDIVMVLTSSGSTGTPKLFFMKDKDVLAQMKRTTYGITEHPNVTAVWNSSDRNNSLFHLYSGGRFLICSLSGDFFALFNQIKLCRPTFLVGTPIFWNAVYQYFQLRLLETLKPCAQENTESQRKEVKKEISKLFGNRLKSITTGGAFIAHDTLNFLRECFSVVTDRYGATETGVIASNGLLHSHIKYKLRDWEEYKYTNYPFPQGELLISVTSSSESSWFETGDIIQLLSPRKIKVIDRKQNLIKQSNGEWIHPEFIENTILSQCSFIHQIYVHTSPGQQRPVALIVPRLAELRYLFEEKLQRKFPLAWQQDNDVERFIGAEIQKISVLRHCEKPGIIAMLENPLNIHDGTITSTMKICRPQIRFLYKCMIEKLVTRSLQEEFCEQVVARSQMCEAVDEIVKASGIATSLVIDSLNAVRISYDIKRKIGKDINPTWFTGKSCTSQQIYQIVQHSFTTEDETHLHPLEYVDWDFEEDNLARVFQENEREGEYYPSRDGDVFLTGSTGFLGGFMLYYILLHFPQDTNVWCLVNSESEAKAKERLYLSVERLECFHNVDWKERIRIVKGSLSEPMFGLSTKDFIELNRKLGSIFHVGAKVSALSRYHELRRTNVQGTIECIRLSVIGYHRGSRHDVCRMNFVSSGAVFNAYPPGPMKETSNLPFVNECMYMDGYSRSKWVADKLCLVARDRFKVPITIFRPGFISAHSISGVGNVNDFDNRFIIGILEVGCLPDLPSALTLDQSPVDWVAESIVRIACLEDSVYQCFHFMNPSGSPTIQRIFSILSQIVEEQHCPLPTVSYESWKEAIQSSHNRLYPLKEFFGTTFPSRSGLRCDMNMTKPVLESLRLEAPFISDTTLHKWLSSLVSMTHDDLLDKHGSSTYQITSVT